MKQESVRLMPQKKHTTFTLIQTRHAHFFYFESLPWKQPGERAQVAKAIQ